MLHAVQKTLLEWNSTKATSTWLKVNYMHAAILSPKITFHILVRVVTLDPEYLSHAVVQHQ